MPSGPDPSPERDSGLSIDDEGRFRHRGEPITHARTLAVLWASLRRDADGRYRVQVGREVGSVEVALAPYGVRGTTPAPAGAGGAPGGLVLHLTDGTLEPLDPATLRVGPDGVLVCTVKGGHQARFQRSAQASLGPLLEEDPGRPGGFALRVSGRAWALRPA